MWARGSDLAPGEVIMPRKDYAVALDLALDTATNSVSAINVVVTKRAPQAEFDYLDTRETGRIHNMVKEFGFLRGERPELTNVFFHASEWRGDEAQARLRTLATQRVARA